jgi:hypothetical protein
MMALHLAAKMEEPSFAKLQVMSRVYKHLTKYRRDEVIWMEERFLNFLGFRLNPPTAKFFTDIGFESGAIGFPSLDIIRLVKHLTDATLVNSLLEYDFTFIKSSVKASVAMQFVTQHVLLNSERLLSAMAFSEESEELKNATRICTGHVRHALRSYQSPCLAQDDSAI